MRSDVLEHLGLTKRLQHVADCATAHHRPRRRERKAAIYAGGRVAFTGVGGRGQTGRLWRLPEP